CEYYRYDNYRQLMRDIKNELKDVMDDVMKNPYVKDKHKYYLAVYCLWVFRLKRRLQNSKK
ncbi:MAG: hypothetical protein ACI4R6_04870, partial [Lachnospiraceae bacterium]